MSPFVSQMSALIDLQQERFDQVHRLCFFYLRLLWFLSVLSRLMIIIMGVINHKSSEGVATKPRSATLQFNHSGHSSVDEVPGADFANEAGY